MQRFRISRVIVELLGFKKVFFVVVLVAEGFCIIGLTRGSFASALVAE